MIPVFVVYPWDFAQSFTRISEGKLRNSKLSMDGKLGEISSRFQNHISALRVSLSDLMILLLKHLRILGGKLNYWKGFYELPFMSKCRHIMIFMHSWIRERRDICSSGRMEKGIDSGSISWSKELFYTKNRTNWTSKDLQFKFFCKLLHFQLRLGVILDFSIFLIYSSFISVLAVRCAQFPLMDGKSTMAGDKVSSLHTCEILR